MRAVALEVAALAARPLRAAEDVPRAVASFFASPPCSPYKEVYASRCALLSCAGKYMLLTAVVAVVMLAWTIYDEMSCWVPVGPK